MKKLILLITLIIPALVRVEDASAEEYDFQTIVNTTVENFHSWGSVDLKDADGKIIRGSYDDIEQWNEGEEIAVAYYSKVGFGVFRKQDSTFYKIDFGLDAMERSLSKCLSSPAGSSTIGANGCYYQSTSMLETEYKYYLDHYIMKGTNEQKNAFGGLDEALKSLQNSTVQIYEAYVDGREGSRYSTIRSEMELELAKAKFNLLKQFVVIDPYEEIGFKEKVDVMPPGAFE